MPTRILVVDDNPTNVEIVQEMLEDEYQVLTASTGEEAIGVASRHQPGVVLLDVMLPGIDGYEVCRRLRTMPGMFRSHIVMMSAKAMPSERAQGIDAGANDYITKPFDDGELRAAIRVVNVPVGG
jgi:two-component system cell cycle response regulator